MTDTADLLKRARWSYGEAVKLFERGKAYELPRAVAYGREALRDYLRAALVKSGHSISSSRLIELAEALWEQNPDFRLSKELETRFKRRTERRPRSYVGLMFQVFGACRRSAGLSVRLPGLTLFACEAA